jgi:hypothetical protein
MSASILICRCCPSDSFGEFMIFPFRLHQELAAKQKPPNPSGYVSIAGCQTRFRVIPDVQEEMYENRSRDATKIRAGRVYYRKADTEKRRLLPEPFSRAIA